MTAAVIIIKFVADLFVVGVKDDEMIISRVKAVIFILLTEHLEHRRFVGKLGLVVAKHVIVRTFKAIENACYLASLVRKRGEVSKLNDKSPLFSLLPPRGIFQVSIARQNPCCDVRRRRRRK